MDRLKALLEEKCNAMNRAAGPHAIAEYSVAREACIRAGMTPGDVESFVGEIARRRRAGR